MIENNDDKPQIDALNRGLVISLAMHVALVLFFIVKAAFFTPESIDFTQAVRVDMVGLPDKLDPANLPAKPEAKENPKPAPAKPEPSPVVEKPAEKKPEPKVETKPEVKLPTKTAKKDDGINLEKTKSKQQNALEKLKAMAAIEKLKEEESKPKPAPPAGTGKATTGAQPIKGNVLSAGTALTGLAKLQHDTYGADLDRHIKERWALPEWLAKRDLKAQARVFIDSRGNILDRKITKSSGNPIYDEEVLATIDRSAPFPAPPEKFVTLVSVDGILIGFPE